MIVEVINDHYCTDARLARWFWCCFRKFLLPPTRQRRIHTGGTDSGGECVAGRRGGGKTRGRHTKTITPIWLHCNTTSGARPSGYDLLHSVCPLANVDVTTFFYSKGGSSKEKKRKAIETSNRPATLYFCKRVARSGRKIGKIWGRELLVHGCVKIHFFYCS